MSPLAYEGLTLPPYVAFFVVFMPLYPDMAVFKFQ